MREVTTNDSPGEANHQRRAFPTAAETKSVRAKPQRVGSSLCCLAVQRQRRISPSAACTQYSLFSRNVPLYARITPTEYTRITRARTHTRRASWRRLAASRRSRRYLPRNAEAHQVREQPCRVRFLSSAPTRAPRLPEYFLSLSPSHSHSREKPCPTRVWPTFLLRVVLFQPPMTTTTTTVHRFQPRTITPRSPTFFSFSPALMTRACPHEACLSGVELDFCGGRRLCIGALRILACFIVQGLSRLCAGVRIVKSSPRETGVVSSTN